MKFDLIHRPRNLRVAQELFEMVHHEIANADRATAALAQDTLERVPGVPSAMRYGLMLMEKEKIDLVQSELTMARIEGAQCLVIAVIASGPHTKTAPRDH